MDVTYKGDFRPSALQRIQEPCQTYGFSVSSDLLSVQGLFKKALAAFTSAGSDEASLANLKKAHTV